MSKLKTSISPLYFLYFMCVVNIIESTRDIMVSLLDQYETEIRETNDTSDELNPVREPCYAAHNNKIIK